MNLIPKKIEACCYLGSSPVAGVLVQLVVHTTHKKNFTFILGPTNEIGMVEISREEIISRAFKQIEVALMDYGLIEKNYSGTFELKAMSQEQISKAIGAYAIFGQKNYPNGHIEKLNSALELGLDIENIKINITN